MIEWGLMPLRRYADFSGRSRRKEYWLFVLLTLIVTIGVTLIGGILFGSGDNQEAGGLLALPLMGLLGLIWLALIVPSIAVQVRRFHDQDKSGWLVLLNLIPYLGALVVLVFMCLEGTRGPNRFGPDPKAAL